MRKDSDNNKNLPSFLNFIRKDSPILFNALNFLRTNSNASSKKSGSIYKKDSIEFKEYYEKNFIEKKEGEDFSTKENDFGISNFIEGKQSSFISTNQKVLNNLEQYVKSNEFKQMIEYDNDAFIKLRNILCELNSITQNSTVPQETRNALELQTIVLQEFINLTQNRLEG